MTSPDLHEARLDRFVDASWRGFWIVAAILALGGLVGAVD